MIKNYSSARISRFSFIPFDESELYERIRSIDKNEFKELEDEYDTHKAFYIISTWKHSPYLSKDRLMYMVKKKPFEYLFALIIVVGIAWVLFDPNSRKD